ncbi:MAG TPA: TraR/DksA C4-type zinc finger protein [Streptosporangiaceae bacterium]|nr:TraR/DksA C4-type zinc finger protein [Streptosporangiaceae bacterium]
MRRSADLCRPEFEVRFLLSAWNVHDKVPPATPGATGQQGTWHLLRAERADTTSRLAALTKDFDDIVGSTAAVAKDDEHDPEGATIAFERAQVMALIGQSRQHLADLDQALGRLGDGSYGSCERCGRPIGADRLNARPATSALRLRGR